MKRNQTIRSIVLLLIGVGMFRYCFIYKSLDEIENPTHHSGLERLDFSLLAAAFVGAGFGTLLVRKAWLGALLGAILGSVIWYICVYVALQLIF